MPEKLSPEELIVKLLKEKTSLQLDVRKNMSDTFVMMKETLSEIAKSLSQKASSVDKRITVLFKDKGEFEANLTIAEDVLVFYMQTNVYLFDQSHQVWQSSYVKNNEGNAYCGIISIYNFLSDSFTYNRANDAGYLIARIFVNHDMHYFVEGKRQLGFLYNDFAHAILDKKALTEIINSAIIYTLAFNLFVPPFDNIKEVSVSAMEEETNRMQFQTGKRLGFRFSADSDQVK
ncbi:MAG TPA: hypothetical protein VK808_09250 [Bacteroidia bacterium]|jgi:hypothetical protein|nr:hypothetical protein [Bacteroidia bacterium]